MKTKAFGGASIQGAWPVLEEGFWGDSAKSYFTVLDGMGGSGLGDIALQEILQSLRQFINAAKELSGEANGLGYSQKEKQLSSIAERLHQHLLNRNKGQSLPRRVGFSLAIASVNSQNIVSLFNVGASSIYLFRNNIFHLVSAPQLWELPEDGLLLPRQALGLENPLIPELKSLSCQPGDILILHSSGFSLQFPGVSEYLLTAFQMRIPGDSLQSLADGVLGEFAASSAFYNQSVLFVEI